MSIPSKRNSTSFSEADLRSGTESPTKPGVYWFQSETMARALMVEVRVMNGELTVWWPNDLSIIRNRTPVDNHIASCAVVRSPLTTRLPTAVNKSNSANVHFRRSLPLSVAQ